MIPSMACPGSTNNHAAQARVRRCTPSRPGRRPHRRSAWLRVVVRLTGHGIRLPDMREGGTGLEREVTFGLPDELFAIPNEQRSGRVFSDGKNFAHLDGKRFFLRVLLPVQLDIGHEYRFGVWLEVAESDAKRIWQTWDKPEYREAGVDGVLANVVPPWGDRLLGAPCHASARNQSDVMFIEASANPALATVLSTPWPVHECEQLIQRVWR